MTNEKRCCVHCLCPSCESRPLCMRVSGDPRHQFRSSLTMMKERNHVLGEYSRRGKTWAILCRRFLPLVAGDRWRLGIAEGTTDRDSLSRVTCPQKAVRVPAQGYDHCDLHQINA